MVTGLYHIVRVAVAIAAALFFMLPAVCRGDDYAGLARHLFKLAQEQGMERFAVDSFSAQGRATREEAARAQLQFSEALFKLPGTGVMDASVLEKLKGRGRPWAQALIRGAVYGEGDGTILVVRFFDLRTGRPMSTMQIALTDAGRGPVVSDFRDAPAGKADSACASLADEVSAANAGKVDIKARYWAARARTPGFSYASLNRPPGSELKDYATTQKFYALLNAYYDQEGPVTLTAAETDALNGLTAKEEEFRRNCAR